MSEEKKKLILIVDDDRGHRELLKNMFIETGYLSEGASNGRQALEKLKSISPDLIITDLEMPEMGGVALCRVLNNDRIRQNIPVLVVTGMEGAGNIFRSLKADGLLEKPYNPEELLHVVSSLL